MTNDTSPAENEYLAAVSGMQETYGWRDTDNTPPREPAVGDFVSGKTAGKHWRGRVEWIEGGRMTLDVGGAWLAVPVADITH